MSDMDAGDASLHGKTPEKQIPAFRAVEVSAESRRSVCGKCLVELGLDVAKANPKPTYTRDRRAGQGFKKYDRLKIACAEIPNP